MGLMANPKNLIKSRENNNRLIFTNRHKIKSKTLESGQQITEQQFVRSLATLQFDIAKREKI